MAIAKNGINGKFSGKVGSIIGYQLGDQNIIRTVGERRKPYSPLELLNQAKMRAVSEFLSPIKPIIRFGFKREKTAGNRIGAFQLAQSYTRKCAIDLNEEGVPFVNPEKVLVSMGEVEPPHRCTVQRDGQQITVRWDPVMENDDRLVVLLYDLDIYREFRYLGAERKEGMEQWEQANLKDTDKPVHVYVAFRNVYLETISNSIYCGTI